MNRRRFRLLAAGVAGIAATTIFLVAIDLFPYHSINHDEAVYLQQAAMILEGQLSLFPPIPDTFRPWFFIEDGSRLYPKYAPVPAVMFAVGELLGTPRLSLALIGAGNVTLTVAIAHEAFDRRTGLLAGMFLLASPLFVIDSSVFLPYAPTTFWNLLFAFAYFRASRREHRSYALLAGLAIGIAFFSRPYTAVLFGLPFIAHALYSLAIGFSRSAEDSRQRLTRLSLTALGGLVGVGLALAYNAQMTGSPWLFPYEAFAPEDGLGFGHREILDHARDYTPALALRVNAEVVRVLFTDWVVGGPLGTLLAVTGVGAFLRRTSFDRRPEFTDAQAKAIIAGLFVSIIVGNVYFWGNLNILGNLDAPGDGLIATLGPYYHFDLLVPTAVFAAHGAVFSFDRVRAWADETVERPRATAVGVALVGLLLLAGASAGALAPTVSENAETTAAYEEAYQPFEDREFSNAVVFLPTPYGDWLNHPFQPLRNDPGFDGDVVYAAGGGPEDIAVASEYPNRTYYRYVYRGDWAPHGGESVTPALQSVQVARGESVTATATLAVPDHADRVSARISTDDGAAYYAVEGTPANLSVALHVQNGSATLAGPGVSSVGENATIPVADTDEVAAEVFVSDSAGGGFSYRLELPVRQENGTVTALSPHQEACLAPANCGGEAAYVAEALPPGIEMETSLRANESVGT